MISFIKEYFEVIVVALLIYTAIFRVPYSLIIIKLDKIISELQAIEMPLRMLSDPMHPINRGISEIENLSKQLDVISSHIDEIKSIAEVYSKENLPSKEDIDWRRKNLF